MGGFPLCGFCSGKQVGSSHPFVPVAPRRARRDGAVRAERRRAGHPLRTAVQRARPGRRRGLEQRQQRLRTATRAPLQQLQADHEAAAALCRKLGYPDCKALREAKEIRLFNKGLTADELKLLGTLGSVLPALELDPIESPRRHAAAGGGAGRGRAAGRDRPPSVRMWATQAPRPSPPPGTRRPAWLKSLEAKLPLALGQALAPALRRLRAGVARPLWQPVRRRGPRRPRGATAAGGVLPTTGGLAQLKLYLQHTQVTDAGCATSPLRSTGARSSQALPV